MIVIYFDSISGRGRSTHTTNEQRLHCTDLVSFFAHHRITGKFGSRRTFRTLLKILFVIVIQIALCSPQVISKTPQFVQWTISRTDGLEPHQHPCLLMLPQIFLKAMKGIASQVDAFLGKSDRICMH